MRRLFLSGVPPLLFLLLTAVVMLWLHDADTYLDANLQRAVQRLFIGVMVIYGLILASRWLDRRAGIKFKDEWDAIRRGNIAVALYLGLRIFGIFVFGASVMFLT